MSDTKAPIHAAPDEVSGNLRSTLDQEPGLFDQMLDTMNGPLGGWARLVFAMLFVGGGALLYSLWMLLHVEGTRETILWATAVIGALVFQGFAKEWLFARMNTNALLREIKQMQPNLAPKP